MEHESQDDQGDWMDSMLTGLGRLEGRSLMFFSRVDLPVPVLDRDGAKERIAGLMVSGGW